ncbi:hypothetical protein Acy02nite_40360 [Actinoplanes cyaneus]|uniref:OmpR/PhoB-type domain-containing protein n=1 Tax=Actinoplanes cyaneus TaxID=52696 RepID=A0A919M1F9_9ACTN|nr:BTAD domain-containing putative transcriptional regulator [Actinoplanes cyaneus]MCW2139623.1 putative ATPase [Actinoplanes cyaneus]GID66155.1 hypothetical protein Acy02nite_40360 [Actinoplanes cyaneus]
MEFGVLGPVRVTDDGMDLPIGGPRHRVLLATLLVHPGAVVSADTLVDVLWGAHPPRSAPDMVHVRVSELRRRLSSSPSHRSGLVVTRPPGYLLAVDHPDTVDAIRFDALLASGRKAATGGDPLAAAARFAEALGLWRGPPFPEIADRVFPRAEIARLEDLRLQALESRLDADLVVGRHAEVVPELQGLVVEHPLRERFWYQLMLALHRSGRSGEALGAYRTARDLFVEELGVEPGAALAGLHSRLLRRESPTPAGEQRTAPHNMPPALTSFVGRQRDLAEIAALLGEARLVTLTGVGGAGKTRLAVETAATLVTEFPDGVWFVDLAAVTDPRLITATVASVLGVNEHPERDLLDQLVVRLRGARMLLVLDNCEHLFPDVAELVRGLLGAVPSVRLLCTSRERLRITGEVLHPVSGLESVSVDGRTDDRADAVELFAQRAASVRARFEMTPDVAAAVGRICARLDGLPLAIELAAARVSGLSPAQIAAALSDRLRLVTQGSQAAIPRHRTLRAVIDWSYDLLDETERRVLDRLAVFVGGFTLEAADRVCRGDDKDLDLVETVGSLVDKSLVTAEVSGGPDYRYRQLETVRAIGLDRLDERGETAAVRELHAVYFTELAASARDGLRGRIQLTSLNQIAAEHGNLRAALTTCLDGGNAESAATIAGSLYPFWDLRGHYREGRDWLARALATGTVSPRTRIGALMGVATLAAIQGDGAAALAASAEAADLSRRTGDAAGLSHALQYQGFIATYAEEFDEATVLLDQAWAAAGQADAPWERAWTLIFMAALELGKGDFPRAVEISLHADRELTAVGDIEAQAWTQSIRAGALWAAGRPGEAVTEMYGAVRDFRDLGGQWGLSLALLLAGVVLEANGKPASGVRMIAAAEALRSSMGVTIQPFLQGWLDRTMAAAEVTLGAPAVRREWTVGERLSPAAAAVEALRELDRGSGVAGLAPVEDG